METVEELEGEEIDETCEQYLRANLVRDEELIKFVEDFMNSEEFHLVQIKTKEREPVEDRISRVCTECWEDVENLDLAQQAQKMREIERRFENFLKNKTAKETVKHQEEGIKVIRAKIAEARSRYECHKQQRDLRQEECRQKVLENLKTFHGVNTDYLATKSKVVDKVLAYNKIRHIQRVKRKQRTVDIIKKILNEHSRQRQIEAVQNKRYDVKVVPKEKILKDMEVVGTKIRLVSRFKPELEAQEEKVEEVEWEEILKPEETSQEKIKKGKKDMTDKKEIKDSKKVKTAKELKKRKDSKKNKKDKKSDKKGKKDKKTKPDKEEKDLVLPFVPITNERHKIKVDEESIMAHLIQEFEAAEEVRREREKFEFQKELAQGVFYPEDSSFFAIPKILTFQGFRNGVKYKIKLRIFNGGKTEKKCRFYLVCLDDFDPTLIEVEPVGAQNVIPGLSFGVTITFSPETLEKTVKGKIIFLTYHSSKNQYTQICVPVFCIPWCSQVSIVPEHVAFDTLPIWKAKEILNFRNYKILKICNTGKKPCQITITKVKSLFQLDDTHSGVIDTDLPKHCEERQTQDPIISTENGQYDLYVPVEESDTVVRKIIDECVDYVFHSFTFDCYCFNMAGKDERTVQVYFRNIDHVGSYNEKYLICVFENSDGKVLECVGSQVRKENLLSFLVRMNVT